MLTGYAAGKLDQISRNFPKQFSSMISLEKCWENLKKNHQNTKKSFLLNASSVRALENLNLLEILSCLFLL